MRIESSASGRRRVVRVDDPKAFIRNLYQSFQRCRAMEVNGSSKEAVGWAFYRMLCEAFGEDYGALPEKRQDPTVATVKAPKPPTAFPPLGKDI